jgi:phosphonopyruvate decarboxylase
MLSPHYFFHFLSEHQIEFFTGVPDSLLKDLCAYITDNCSSENHIIAANEGLAIGLATGYYLATGKIPVVYMQNSGIGNAINPLLSLVDKEVYNIPILLLIGWRGEPKVKDEPQHIEQGKLTIPLLETMGIQNAILSVNPEEFTIQLTNALDYMNKTKESFAFVIQKDTFEKYQLQNSIIENFPMLRESAIRTVTDSIDESAIVISTTGMISRELFEYREHFRQSHERDFLTVGSMGHASQIALGIALQKKEKKIYCLDGDGALLMHMGSLAIIGSVKPENFIHIVFNNGAHDSVGGQPTVGLEIELPAIASSCGYLFTASVDENQALREILQSIRTIKGPVLIEIKVRKGSRKDLGRPTATPIQNKEAFMRYLQK